MGFPSATLTVTHSWEDLLQRGARAALEAILPGYIHPRRWFGAKSRQIDSARIVEAIRLPYGDAAAYLTLVHLAYAGGGGDMYALPLAFAADEAAGRLSETPHALIARVGGGVLFDASFDPAFCATLLAIIAEGRLRRCSSGR